METMSYRAVDSHGRLCSGTLLAADKGALEYQLELRGLTLLRTSRWHEFIARLYKISGSTLCPPSALVMLTYHLAHLLEGGVPLLAALDEIAVLERKGALKILLCAIRDRISQGDALSDALEFYPAVFDARYIAVVRAGEASGQLSVCLSELEQSLRWQQGLAERLKTVLVYPIFAASSLSVLVFFLLYSLVPAMQPFIALSNQTLSWHTRGLLGASAAVHNHGIVFSVGAGIVLVCLLSWIGRFKSGRYCWHIFLLRSGPIGQALLQLSLARFSQTLSLLYRSGVELTDALKLSQHTVGNVALTRSIGEVIEQIAEGSSFSAALGSARWMPTMLIRLVAAGESTGALADALLQASVQLQATAQHTLNRFERVLNPLLLCVVGSVLFWIVLAVLGPIYNTVLSSSMVF